MEHYTTYDGKLLELNLHFPENWNKDDRRGLVIFFFGGGWTRGTTGQFVPHAHELNRLGMVVATPQYRVKFRDGTTVDTAIRDAVYCVNWLYTHAEQLGVDPEKIVIGGGSAGAHIGLSAVVLDRFIPGEFHYASHIRGLILCNPVLDTVEFGEKSEAIRETPMDPRELSPFHHIREKMPDVIVLQGEEDTTVSPATAKKFVEQVSARGSKAELVSYPGCIHGFFNFKRNQLPAYYDVLRHMVEFLLEEDMFDFESAMP